MLIDLSLKVQGPNLFPSYPEIVLGRSPKGPEIPTNEVGLRDPPGKYNFLGRNWGRTGREEYDPSHAYLHGKVLLSYTVVYSQGLSVVARK